MRVSVRATIAHANIRRVDIAAVAKMAGVLAVIAGRDLTVGNVGAMRTIATFTRRDGKSVFRAATPVLSAERVRSVGDAVVRVIAGTAPEMQDAPGVVDGRVEALAVATNGERALARDAPTL
jgi:carbon-monoxide dehydrogenase large subunit